MKHKNHIIRFMCVLLPVFSFIFADEIYRNQKATDYQADIHEVTAIMEQEKQWIRLNQNADGAIALNRESAPGGDVNPYFACQAALGLLAGNADQTNLNCTAAYLNWHIQEFLKHQGAISNYQYVRGNGLVPTGKYDSVDSYIAMLLILTARYEEKGGDLRKIASLKDMLFLSQEKLNSLASDGLTMVSAENRTLYLMDNAEVSYACRRISAMLTHTGPGTVPEDLRQQLYTAFDGLGKRCDASIERRLWNNTAGRYDLGIDRDGKRIVYRGSAYFYPETIAQLYPYIYGSEKMDSARADSIYQQVCRDYPLWDQMKIEGTSTEWPSLAYAAASAGDIKRAVEYLRSYKSRHLLDRKYPLNTADAGWVAETCEIILKFYQNNTADGIAAELEKKV